MPTKLIVARHGNTFTKSQTPTRVGANTDLPLVEYDRATAIGKYLKQTNQVPDVVFTSPLSRTIQTAMYVMKALGKQHYDLKVTSLFTEIDYGPDENKTEDEVEYRLGLAYLESEAKNSTTFSEKQIKQYGKDQIKLWNAKAIVPYGWNVNPNTIIEQWRTFGIRLVKEYLNQTVLVLTSNGIARFSPWLLVDCYDFISKKESLKITTGGISTFKTVEVTNGIQDSYVWQNLLWNFSPYRHYKDNANKNQ